jgi:putrescine transport system ATP-binding protein
MNQRLAELARPAPTTSGFVRIAGISKSFGLHKAVDNVSLDIGQGELFSLLGSSGCGKTTLLRILAGFERPSAGRVIIDGIDLTATPPYLRPVSMMFQSYALFPHMSVMDNVAFGLRREGVRGAELKNRVEAMLAAVQLEAMSTRRPHQLSGGQRQRVALARSLVKRPKVLLLDEPLGALDRKLRETTQFELVKLQRELGITFIVVTHDQEEAMTLSTRIGVMKDGQIVQVGQPREIYEFPSTRFVADFIGSANLFEGEILRGRPNRMGCADVAGELAIANGNLAEGARCWLAVRPEKIGLVQPPAAPAMALHGKVTGLAYFGSQSVYMVELPSGRTLRVAETIQNRLLPPTFAVGDAVAAFWDVDAGIVLVS